MPEETPDFFTGFTQPEVEAMFAKLKLELSKTLAAFSSGDQSVTKRTLADIRLNVKGCQKALRKFDPDTYGKTHRSFVSTVGQTLNR